ncbi:MAG: PhzF family phenazine biosynthesis protein [Euryarchaeota archaeon]|nr:PhzF family phenazine biosynthesis protein [Euryarchaeota archaeon]
MNVNVLKVNAFTDSLQGGNPAGVVLDSPDLTDKQMKQISKQLNVSETAFVFHSSVADVNVRFFSPTVEVNLCGHATIATFFVMALKGLLKKNTVVTQETKAGILPVTIVNIEDNRIDRVMMTQNNPIYKDISFNISLIADSLNINQEDIDDSLPKQMVSTGLFTIPICVQSFDVLKNMKPDFNKIKNMCEKFGAGSFHVFTFETKEPDSVYHARNFAPVYGVNEDPVTGTANGAVSSYLLHHKIIKNKNLVCEQGDIIGRPGRVFVKITDNVVQVGGKATIALEKTLTV